MSLVDDVVTGIEFDRVRLARRKHLRSQRRNRRVSSRVRTLGRHRRWGRTLAATGLLVGHDGVTWQNLPRDTPVAAGYVDGFYRWPDSAWNNFSGFHLRIAVHASTVTSSVGLPDVLDIEAGDATPDQGPGWLRTLRNEGHPNPGLYCSLAVLGQVLGACDAQGVARPWMWVAAYPGCGPSLCGYTNAYGHQYADPGPYDLSVWDPAITTIRGGSVPTPAPPRSKEEGMLGVSDPNQGGDGNAWHFGVGFAHSLSGQPERYAELKFVGNADLGPVHPWTLIHWMQNYDAWDYDANAPRRSELIGSGSGTPGPEGPPGPPGKDGVVAGPFAVTISGSGTATP